MTATINNIFFYYQIKTSVNFWCR